MKITVKHIYNTQAIEVKGADWKIAFQNQSQFNYLNDRLNGFKMIIPSNEYMEGIKGNY